MKRRSMVIVGLTVLGLTLVSWLALDASSGSVSLALQDVSEGGELYEANCASCHQSNGEGVAGAFPPLAGNPRSADTAYVEDVIRNGQSGPIEVLGVTYDAVMPPVSLTDGEISAIAAYVATFAEDVTPSTTAASGPVEGDTARGERLFAGAAGFENGGPACRACHSAGPVGFAGGTGLGPDLTHTFDTLGGEAGLSAWLANPASPTMQPLFVDKELTEGEISDVTAFLGSVTEEDRPGGIDLLWVGGALGLAVLLGLMALFIRGPQETYTQRLRRQQ